MSTAQIYSSPSTPTSRDSRTVMVRKWKLSNITMTFFWKKSKTCSLSSFSRLTTSYWHRSGSAILWLSITWVNGSALWNRIQWKRNTREDCSCSTQKEWKIKKPHTCRTSSNKIKQWWTKKWKSKKTKKTTMTFTAPKKTCPAPVSACPDSIPSGNPHNKNDPIYFMNFLGYKLIPVLNDIFFSTNQLNKANLLLKFNFSHFIYQSHYII